MAAPRLIAQRANHAGDDCTRASLVIDNEDKPVWVCLPSNCVWRWMLARLNTPWYGSARLFRQRRVGDWVTLFEEVAAALSQLVRGNGGCPF
jgi:hypothetical protein